MDVAFLTTGHIPRLSRWKISKLDTDFRDKNLVSGFRRRYNYFNIKGISDAYDWNIQEINNIAVKITHI